MAHWRDTFKPARFFFLEAVAGVPLVAVLLYMRWWTLTLALFFVVLFWVLERRGLSMWAAMRACRAWIIGDQRPPKPKSKIRSRIDYQRRPYK